MADYKQCQVVVELAVTHGETLVVYVSGKGGDPLAPPRPVLVCSTVVGRAA